MLLKYRPFCRLPSLSLASPSLSSLCARPRPRIPNPSPVTAMYLLASGVSSSPPAQKMFHFPHVDAIASSADEFRTVLWTGVHSQLVIMTIPPGGEIGEEVHTVDQILVFTKGTSRAIIEGEEKDVKAGDLVIVPAGAKHNFLNQTDEPLVLYTVYAPAEHNYNTIHRTKEEGEKAEAEGLDEPPEWAKPKA